MIFIMIDGLDLLSKIIVLKKLRKYENTPMNVLNYLKMLDSFPNTYIAYRILLTMHVTIAYA